MTLFKGRMSAGAPGGYWEVFDEAQHSDVVRQDTDNSCGPACAEMLFRSRGFLSISQQDIVAVQGSERSTDESLAEAMNSVQREQQLDDGGEWHSAWWDTLSAPLDLFRRLAARPVRHVGKIVRVGLAHGGHRWIRRDRSSRRERSL